MKKVLFFCAVILFNSEAVLANKVTKLEVIPKDGYPSASTIYVYSTNGEKWNKVDDTKLITFNVGLRAKCRFEGKGNKAYRGNLYIKGFEKAGEMTPKHHMIPHVDSTRRAFRYIDNDELNPVKACNVELEKKLSANANKTKYDFLAQGFKINYPAAFTLNYELICKPTGIGLRNFGVESVKVNAVINCQASGLAKEKLPKPKTKPVPIKKAQLVDFIKKVEFAPKVKHIVGACPAQVEYNGSITANRFGTVEYQYVSHDGRKSPKLKLEFDKAGTKKLRTWRRTINKDDNNSFKRAVRQGQKAYDYQGWYRLDILSPKDIKSIKKEYTLSCQKKDMQFKN